MKIIILVILTFFYTQQINAATYSYDFAGSWSTEYTGEFGSEYQASISFDNGNNTAINQEYVTNDYLSFRFISGSIDHTFTTDDSPSIFINFLTNADGILYNGAMNLGDSTSLWRLSIFDLGDGDGTLRNQTNTQIARFFGARLSEAGKLVAPIPSPPTVWLISLGLLGQLGVYRKKKLKLLQDSTT